MSKDKKPWYIFESRKGTTPLDVNNDAQCVAEANRAPLKKIFNKPSGQNIVDRVITKKEKKALAIELKQKGISKRKYTKQMVTLAKTS